MNLAKTKHNWQRNNPNHTCRSHNIANDETLSKRSKASQAAAAEPLKLSPNYKLLGSVYELSGTTEASISIKFNQAVSVTLDYSGLNLNGVVEDNLDVYYYKEDKGQWTAMNGTLITTKL